MPFIGPHQIYTIAGSDNVARVMDWQTLATSVNTAIEDVESTALAAKSDAADASAMAVGAKETAERLGTILNGDEWLWVVVDANDNILGGFKADGSFETYGPGGGGGGGSDVSVWPAVAHGDSTTQGADLADESAERWSTLLAASLGATIINRGASGARAEEITARQGGISVTAKVSGGTIPASGTVNLTDLEVDPVRSGAVSSYGVEIAGVPGTLSRSGSDRVFTRSTTGSAVSVPGLVDVYSNEGRSTRGDFHFIGQGTNNIPLIEEGDQTVDQLCAWYAAQTSTLTPAKARFIVWGVLDRGVGEGEGTVRGGIIRELEAFLAKTYGAAFVNVRAYLASYRALEEAGISPTSGDDAAIAVGSIPPSLRSSSGSVHLNAIGHVLQAALFERHITRNGLITP